VFTVLIFSISFALVISATCSVFEAVLYSLSPGQVELMQEKHPQQAEIMRAMKENIDQPITAILTLNTIANTIGAAVAGAAAVAVFGQNSLLWFSLSFTLAILLFSEILPKTIGVVYAKQLGPFIALPLNIIIFILKPIILFCKAITKLVPHQDSSRQISAEELQTIARLSLKSGEIEPDQETVITNILKLNHKTVRQVMTPRTVTFSLDKNLNIRQAAQFGEQWRMHSRAPVFDGEQDNIEGIVLSRDVFMEAAENKYDTKLTDIMQPVYFIPETAPLNKVFIDFLERHQHLFVVVDEYGSATGVISMEDIIEEIVGREIVDESDRASDMREFARQARKKIQPDTA
jgi:CBS domain containing-hemolysin-like protein